MGDLGPGRLEPRSARTTARGDRLQPVAGSSSGRIVSMDGHGRRPLPLRRQEQAARRVRVEVALAMLGDVLEAAVGARRPRAARHRRRGRRARGGGARRRRSSPTRAAARARRSGAALAGIDGVCLVVNADVPARPPIRPDRARHPSAGRRRRDRRGARTGRQTRSVFRSPRCSSRSTGRAAPRSSGRTRPRSGSSSTTSTCRTSATTSTPRPISSASARAAAHGRAR